MRKTLPENHAGFRKDEGGSTAVETAFVLPVFLLLLIGFFYFAIVLFGFCNATYAARAAVRYASMSSSTSLVPATADSVNTLVKSYLYAAPATTVSTTWTAGNTVGSIVHVTVQITYPLGIPYFNLSQITIGSSAQRIVIR